MNEYLSRELGASNEMEDLAKGSSTFLSLSYLCFSLSYLCLGLQGDHVEIDMIREKHEAPSLNKDPL